MRLAPESLPTDEQRAQARLGTTVGNYRLEAIAGRGGMGTVYLAEHVYIGKHVAVKILHERLARNAEAVGRFVREARTASAINHPNIVGVADFGHGAGGEVYLAMELLEGRSLEELLGDAAPLPLHRAIGIVHQLASALAAAHAKGIVHADLKPANVMLIGRPGRRELIRAEGAGFIVEKESAYDFVKVLDFGIARMHDPDAPATEAVHVFGTPEYMSPEAARGEAVGPASDIYELGVMFYEMVVGDVPFHAESPLGVLRKHLGEVPVPPRQAAPHAEITPAAERLILRALAKDPAGRPPSMLDLRAELPGCYGSVAFRRDAHRVPAAVALGLAPRKKRLTEELDEWLAREKAALAAALAGPPGEPARGEPPPGDPPPGESPPAEPANAEILLLTERKPIY